jgi:DNA-binding MarR family transcriptional regulator
MRGSVKCTLNSHGVTLIIDRKRQSAACFFVDIGNKNDIIILFPQETKKRGFMTKDEGLSSIFNRVSERHNMIKNIEEKKFKFMTENTYMEVHCIELIEKIQDANVTKLSKTFQVTRGAISKVTKRLIEAGAIERYQKPENKKEIYFKLTDMGKGIYWEHEKMHQTRIERDSKFFNQLSEEEKDHLIQMLNKIYGQIAEELKELGMDNYI